jgi:putative ABC transport system permease protein
MVSISLGVGALVAINSFRTNILASIQVESRNLLGADLELHGRVPFAQRIVQVLDSLEGSGHGVAYVTTVASMAATPDAEFSRLVQIKAVRGAYPFYGQIGTHPASGWETFRSGQYAVVDRAVVVELDVAVGDTINVNGYPLEIAGVVTTSPGEISFQGAIGPRVFISEDHLEAMNLIRMGSLARYQAYLAIGGPEAVQELIDTMRPEFREHDVGYDTVAERVGELTDAMTSMTRFLGLVGLVALLLGGVGVASAVHVFIKERLDTVAVLRCIGARQSTVFAAYLFQATAMGFIGALGGVALGTGVQFGLPALLRDFLPVDVPVSVDWVMMGAGLLIGIWVAGIFAFLPLLAIRDVPPLRALRSAYEATRTRGRWLRLCAFVALATSVVAISVWQAPAPQIGVAFAAAISVTTALLWLTAKLLIWLTKRYFPKRARYVIRQGIANLFRPQNQTVAVTIALGFGAFLVGTIYVVQRNLLDKFDLQDNAEAPNITAFDIQPDQRTAVLELFNRTDGTVSLTPLIPARMSHVNGRSIAEILEDTTRRRPPRWALVREYRHTYRDSTSNTEAVIEGNWWNDSGDSSVTGDTTHHASRISIEDDLARMLDLTLGDRITWNIQGIAVESEISNIRRVDWARLDLNFFVVFEPGLIEELPHTTIAMARIDDPTQRANLQRDIVRQFANVSVIDLTLVQETVSRIIGKVTLAIRFMALFSIASGIVVLVGAIATSQFHRIRESVLLKTLGASKRQIRQIFSTEYAALGTLAGFTGVLLSGVAGWILIRFFFGFTFRVPGLPLVGIWLSAVAVTTAVGLASSRKVLAKPPLAVIREIAE